MANKPTPFCNAMITLRGPLAGNNKVFFRYCKIARKKIDSSLPCSKTTSRQSRNKWINTNRK